MPSLLDTCRTRLGPPPRTLSSEDVRKLRLIWWPCPLGPPPFDPLFRVYLAQKKLRERGEVVWGFLLQANSALWQPGFEPSAATVIHGGPELEDVQLLANVAQILYQLKGTRQTDPDLKAAVGLTHETWRKMQKPIPAKLTGGHTVYCTDLMVHRGHLPGHRSMACLKKPLLPLLVNPAETKAVMVLPAEFWPLKLLEIWEEG